LADGRTYRAKAARLQFRNWTAAFTRRSGFETRKARDETQLKHTSHCGQHCWRFNALMDALQRRTDAWK
jgi:hypothetical protein